MPNTPSIPTVPLIEPKLIREVFAMGVDSVASEDMVRLLFWTESLECAERLVVAKLIIPPRRFCHVRRALIGAAAKNVH